MGSSEGVRIDDKKLNHDLRGSDGLVGSRGSDWNILTVHRPHVVPKRAGFRIDDSDRQRLRVLNCLLDSKAMSGTVDQVFTKGEG